jgi:hypothetical protein
MKENVLDPEIVDAFVELIRVYGPPCGVENPDT